MDLALELPPPPWIVGHRGAAGEAPENTLEGFLTAVEEGADMVEIDLRLTSDGRLVAFHDRDLRRLQGDPGEIEALSLGELRERSAAPVPTLEQALEVLPARLPLNLELKPGRGGGQALLRALAERLAGRAQVLLSSFDWRLLADCRRQLPGRPLAPLGDRRGGDLLAAARELGAFSLHCHRRLATRALVDAAGRPTLVYTVNRPAAARRLLLRGVAGLFTDHPGRLRRGLEGAT